MRKIIICLFCLFGTLAVPMHANEDLIRLLHLAVENKDLTLVREVIEALLVSENNSKNLLDAISKYNEKGKIDFALHRAIKNKDLLSSVVLAHHAKDVNTRYNDGMAGGARVGRDGKTPIELALDVDMIEIIPYLLQIKNANPYLMRKITYIYEDEDQINYLKDLDLTDFHVTRKICTRTKKPFFDFTFPFTRTFIGDAIAKNRLDFIEVLQKAKFDWNKICVTGGSIGTFTPLQYALFLKRYEIAQFLINHGARIE
ncbi:MAG: hypothetical protein LLG04_01295 [Parachlamydia sp.]|nr:hypothetical protein [Parachlamydia sp.]